MKIAEIQGLIFSLVVIEKFGTPFIAVKLKVCDSL